MLKKTRMNNFLLCIGYIIVNFVTLTYSYPIESKPLNDDPGTWFGDEWLIFSPRASLDSSALPLIGHDLSHVKKSKITPKSIFIAPNTLNHAHADCPSGYRVDENGKCIKVVKINQDELLAARISELFKIDINHKKSEPDTYADYYDSDDGKLPGPLQVNLPLAVDFNDDETEEKTRVTYLIAEKVDDTELTTLSTTIEPSVTVLNDVSTIPSDSYNIEFTNPTTTEESITSTTFLSNEGLDDETTTVAFEKLVELSIPTTTAISESTELTTSFFQINVTETSTINEKFFPQTSSLSQTFPTSTTKKPFTTTKVFSVDFLPKSLRKQSISSRLKNYREQVDKSKNNRTITRNIMNIEKNAFNSKKDFTSNYTSRFPNKNYPKTPAPSESPFNFVKPLEKIDSNSSKKSISATNEPFWWLPKGWQVNESKEKPTLVRFWAQQPLKLDGKLENSRQQFPKPPSQRQNSRMPTGNIFHEMSLNEMEGNLKQK